MKNKLYTQSHNKALLDEIGNGQFTSEEHAFVLEKEFGDTVFSSRESLLKYYLSNNINKLCALQLLNSIVVTKGYRNILSLGAGPCVLEYLLKLSLSESTNVIASDFDAFFIEKASVYFPEVLALRFDFFNDSINSFLSENNIKADLAIFFGSAYVMDDNDFIKLFKGLKECGVSQVIDFHAGYMDCIGVIKSIISPVTKNRKIRKLFGKSQTIDLQKAGKFHGYSRSRSELMRLYRSSGWTVVRKIKVSGYKFIAILE